MKYQELLDRFWGMDKDFSCAEITLYLYLLHRCNSLGWPDTFSLSNEELVERLKCCRKSISAARSALVNAGLLQYQARFGRGDNSFYKIVAENDNNLEEKWQNRNTFNEKVAKSLHFSEKEELKINNLEEKWQNRNTFNEEPKEKNKEKISPAPLIKEKKKEITQSNTLLRANSFSNAHTCASEDKNGQLEIVFKDLKEKPLKKKREPVEPILPRDMEEVAAFFEKNAADKLPEWKAEAELFFYHYESLGWVGTSNRKIQDWESRANLWISDKALALKNGEQERRQTEIDARNLRPYGRTTGVPKEGGGGKMLPQPRVRECNEQDDTPKDYTKGF